MTDQPAGPLVDALGVTLDLNPHQQLTEALVIGKVIDFENPDAGAVLILGSSEGLDWIANLGLIHAALQVAQDSPLIRPDD